MKKVKDAEILDILPFTFKDGGRSEALSAGIAALTALFYRQMAAVLFWGDIQHAAPELLDIMAAQVDAPFYRDTLGDEVKRDIIEAAYSFNSRIGTVSAVEALLKASFGGGEILQWYEYGGDPYYFRLVIDPPSAAIAEDGYALIASMLYRLKPLRAKLDALRVAYDNAAAYSYGIGEARSEKRVHVMITPDMLWVYLTDALDEPLADAAGGALRVREKAGEYSIRRTEYTPYVAGVATATRIIREHGCTASEYSGNRDTIDMRYGIGHMETIKKTGR